jgi:hypothetical protein
MNVDSLLKDEFSNLKQIEKRLLIELYSDPENKELVEDSLACVRYSLEKCIEDMKFFGVVVGAQRA